MSTYFPSRPKQLGWPLGPSRLHEPVPSGASSPPSSRRRKAVTATTTAIDPSPKQRLRSPRCCSPTRNVLRSSTWCLISSLIFLTSVWPAYSSLSGPMTGNVALWFTDGG
ncbi:hypothetical protein ACFXTH_018937 [Malus domestica]